MDPSICTLYATYGTTYVCISGSLFPFLKKDGLDVLTFSTIQKKVNAGLHHENCLFGICFKLSKTALLLQDLHSNHHELMYSQSALNF